MAPVVHGLEQQWGDRINFVYLDIDDPDTTPFKREFGYIYQPHFLLLDGEGQIVKQWIGPVSEDAFVSAFETVVP
jgi:hypothetical protein